MDEFEAMLDESLLAWGIDTTVTEVILTFLEKVNLLSYRDSSIEVHIAVTSVRRKLILAIEKTPLTTNNPKTALLFLPKKEHYDLILLYMNYKLRKRGMKVLYLGINISTDNLMNICTQKKPDYLYSYIASKHNFPIAEYINLMTDPLKETQLYVSYADIDNRMSLSNQPTWSFSITGK
jgi:hypothetical protein